MASIEQTIQLNKLLEEQNKLLAEQTKMFSQQLQMTKQIVEMQERLAESASRQNDRTQGLSDAIEEVANNIGNLEGQQQSVFEELLKNIDQSNAGFEGMAKGIKKVSKFALFIAPAVAGLSGFARGLQFSTNLLMSMASVATTVVGALFNLGASIVALPFKLFHNFLEAGIQGSTALREAFESARKELGALGTNEGAATIQAFRAMRGELSQTGLSVWRTFGNLAERMQWVNETAQNLGVTFSLVRNQFAQNVESIGAYIKGLGLSQEAQRTMAEESIRSGRSMTEIGREITTMAYGMGQAFGINGKLISRDVGEMTADFDNFGNMATKTLTSVAVFARKLGVEIKGLLGIVGKFDNFEDAAQSAANLSQAFGLNVDALQMLQEQDPAARIDKLRKAFFAAGKSVENMTRQERALLAQHTGLDQKTASLVFSQQNQAMSYEDIQKQSELTEKKQLSQAEAMEKLAGSIERMVKQGDKITKGFFSTFADGFNIGLRRSKEFRESWRTVQRSLRMTRLMGVRLGRDFMKLFPGIKDMFAGIRDFFSPRRVKSLVQPISNALRGFFKGDMSFEEVFNTIKTQFKSFFNPSGEAATKFKSGLTAFVSKMSEIFKEIGAFAVRHLTDGFTFVADWIRNGKMPDMKGAAGGAQTWFSENIWDPLVKWLKSEEVTKLKDAFIDMMSVAWEKFKDWAIGFAKDNIVLLGGILFGPAILTSIVNTLVVGLGTALLKGGPRIASSIGGALTSVFSSTKIPGADKIGKGVQAGVGDAVAKSVNSASKAQEAMSKTKFGKGDAAKMLAIGAFMAVGMTAVVYGILKITEAIKENDFSMADLAKAAATMGMAGIILAEAAGVAALATLVGKAVKSSAANAVVGLVAIEVVAAAMGATAWVMIKVFSGFSKSSITKTQDVMKIMGDLFLAASLVTGVAALVGTGIMATAGVGAIAIVAGLATLGTVLASMATAAIAIIKTVTSIKMGPDSVMKMKVFQIGIESIGNFAKDFAAITKAVKPNIIDSIFGTDTMTDRLEALTGLMSKLGETLTSTKEGNKGIIPTIIDATKEVSQSDIDKAMGIAKIIDSVVRIVDVVGKQIDRLKDNSVSGFLFGRGPSSELMDKMKDFFGTTLVGVAESMKKSIGVLGRISVDPDKVKSIKTMTNILWSTIKSLQGLTPEKIDKMNTIIPRIPAVVQNMTRSIKLIEAPVAQIQDETVTRVRTSVTAMIQTINEINRGIKGLGKIRLGAELKTLSDRLGLGANRRLTIDKGDLNINIDVKVQLKVDELEEALTTRSGGARFQVSPNNPFKS